MFAGMSWVRGNAECLPVGDNLYDAYTVAFGIRNMTHMDAVSIPDSALYVGPSLWHGLGVQYINCNQVWLYVQVVSNKDVLVLNDK